jgi:hypothetical protein
LIQFSGADSRLCLKSSSHCINYLSYLTLVTSECVSYKDVYRWHVSGLQNSRQSHCCCRVRCFTPHNYICQSQLVQILNRLSLLNNLQTLNLYFAKSPPLAVQPSFGRFFPNGERFIGARLQGCKVFSCRCCGCVHSWRCTRLPGVLWCYFSHSVIKVLFSNTT